VVSSHELPMVMVAVVVVVMAIASSFEDYCGRLSNVCARLLEHNWGLHILHGSDANHRLDILNRLLDELLGVLLGDDEARGSGTQ